MTHGENKNLLDKLNNHQKLIGMISDKVLPIKQALIDNCREIQGILEKSFYKEKKSNDK